MTTITVCITKRGELNMRDELRIIDISNPIERVCYEMKQDYKARQEEYNELVERGEYQC